MEGASASFVGLMNAGKALALETLPKVRRVGCLLLVDMASVPEEGTTDCSFRLGNGSWKVLGVVHEGVYPRSKVSPKGAVAMSFN